MTLEYTKEECRLSLTSEDYIKPLCGCDIANRVIKFCSIHKAAPAMYEVLLGIMDRANDPNRSILAGLNWEA
ncbi:hypothetical protein LCGC14_1881460, partial [marine sediment metagenome]